MRERWSRGNREAFHLTARTILEVRYASTTSSDPIRDTLDRLRPEDLPPVWEYVDSLEQVGWIRDAEASRWKEAILVMMESLGLDTQIFLPDPDDLVLEARDARAPRPIH